MGGTHIGSKKRNQLHNQSQIKSKSQLQTLSLSTRELSDKKPSYQVGGSLLYGKGMTAGTSGHNGFDKKYLAIM